MQGASKMIDEVKKHLPEPVYDAEPSLKELYYKTWELVYKHVKDIPGMPQNPYMDEGFCETQIWIWDTCFMSLFCKYAPDVFPGVESLHNFYDVMYGTKKLPQVITPENEPAWTGWKPGEKATIRIHIADNPPLFAWAEYENALYTGDKDHIRDLLNAGFLQKHYEWLENLKAPFTVEWLQCPTCWITHSNGYSWEGGRSGMDNTPRGRKGSKADSDRPATPDLLWLDAIAQQAFSAECIAELFELIGEPEKAKPWKARSEKKKELLRSWYWDDEDAIFYDRLLSSGEFCKVPSIASFWPLTVGAATKAQADAMTMKLEDPLYFGGERPFPALARKDADYVADGGNYWRGGVWLPTAYMTLKGLLRYGKFDIARTNAEKLLGHMNRVYQNVEPHTIWECYSPSKDEPAKTVDNKNTVRKDFCGWSALGPISIFIEFLIGIHTADAFRNRVCWKPNRNAKGKSGVKNLRFGNVTTSLIHENGICTISSDHDYTLEIDGVPHQIHAGTQEISL